MGATLSKADDPGKNPKLVKTHKRDKNGRWGSHWVLPENAPAADARSASLYDHRNRPLLNIDAKAEARAKALFGETLRDEQWAGLVGAVSGSKVNVREWREDELSHEPLLLFQVEHPGYNAERFAYFATARDLEMYNWRITKEANAAGRDLGERLGLRVLARQVATAEPLGVRRIIAEMAGWPGHPTYIGYKLWPKYGFEASLPTDVRRAYAAYFGLKNHRRVPTQLSQVAADPQAWEWWRRYGGVPLRGIFEFGISQYSMQKMLDSLEKEGICLPHPK